MPSLAQKLTHLMLDTVTVEKYAGTDSYGKFTYTTPATTHKCRTVQKNRLVRNSKGEEVVSSTTIYLSESVGVSVNDRITLADGSQPRILAPGFSPDRNGSRCEVIYT